MVHGEKKDVAITDGIPTSRPGVAFLFAALVLIFATQLAGGFDSKTQTLNFFGTSLQLGEGEENEIDEQGDTNKENKSNEDEEDDDDD